MVTTDLNARVRVESAAPEGARITVRPSLGPLAEPVDLVVLDLDQGGSELIEEAVRIGTGRSEIKWVGYFSHIDEELGSKAKAAGIEAIPRGRFWRELPDLLG